MKGGPRSSSLLSFIAALLILCRGSLSFANNECHASRRSVHPSRLCAETETEAREEAAGNRLLIFGLGNVGTLVAQRGADLKSHDSDAPYFDCVYGTTRSGKGTSGIQTIGFDDSRKLKDILPSCTHMLATIPPMDQGNATFLCDPVLNHPNISLKELLPANAWVGYISSTSIYGNHDGEWVDETSEVRCEPGSKAELYYVAENEWRHAARECGWRLHVFRAAGLYGDNRSAIHTIRKRGIGDSVTMGGPSKKSFPTSRIHEEDVSRSCLSAMMRNEPSAGDFCLWNLADDEPAPRSEVMAFGAQLLIESNLLPLEKTEKSSSMPHRSERDSRRKTDRKRVANRRMKETLLPDGELLYPTYREGLRAVLESNRDKWSSSE